MKKDVCIDIKKIQEISSKLKQPTTYEQQLEILKKRNLVVGDEQKALEILRRINYYYITGYLYEFKNRESGKYTEKISFEDVYQIIKFDMRFRNILLYAIEMIERNLKTVIAYNFSHSYSNGNIAYLCGENFKDKKEHLKFLGYILENIERNRELPFIKHHKENYSGYLPIWVAIEVFTLGNLENFYSILDTRVQKIIAREFGCTKIQLKSWIEAMRRFRNMLAHNTRLYNFRVDFTPVKKKEYNVATNKIFDYVVVMKYLMLDIKEWNERIIISLKDVFEEFKEYVDIENIGFSKDWENILRKEKKV